jgi:hypothetical protein
MRWRKSEETIPACGLTQNVAKEFVMPGLVPGIHVFLSWCIKDVDGRDKPGHDGGDQAEMRERSASASGRVFEENVISSYPLAATSLMIPTYFGVPPL